MQPNSNSRKIHLVYGVDDKFLPCLLVSLYTALSAVLGPVKVTIFVVGQQFDSSEIYRLIKHFSNIELTIRRIKVEDFTEFEIETKGTRYSAATMVPLFIPSLIEEKCLFLDADTLILQDISKLFDTNLNGALIGAVRAYSSACKIILASRPSITNALLRPRNINMLRDLQEKADRMEFTLEEFAAKYFSSGVVLFDSPEIRKADPQNNLIDLRSSRKYWKYLPDEEYLNYFFYDKVYYFDIKWNVHLEYRRFQRKHFPIEFEEQLGSAMRNPGILHFANFYRKFPWKRSNYIARKRYRIYKQVCQDLQNQTGINVTPMFEARK